jgi:hypothetical protein
MTIQTPFKAKNAVARARFLHYLANDEHFKEDGTFVKYDGFGVVKSFDHLNSKGKLIKRKFQGLLMEIDNVDGSLPFHVMHL